MRPSHEVTIAFGTLFEVALGGRPIARRVDVITNVGRGNSFFVASFRIGADPEIIPMLSGGTGGPENIHRIVGNMPLWRIIAAYNRGYEESGFRMPISKVFSLWRSSLEGSRTLRW